MPETDPDPLVALAASLSENLRFVRQKRGMTQDQLARLCGLPRSTVANLETGSSNPTLLVLARLARALHLSLEELLSPPKSRCQVFPRGSLPIQSRGKGAKALVHKLLPHPIPGMEIDRMALEPGARIVGVPHRPGTHEYFCCEAGQLELLVAGEVLDLAPGDVAAFPGDQHHSYRNRGDVPAIGFSVVTLAPLPGSG